MDKNISPITESILIVARAADRNEERILDVAKVVDYNEKMLNKLAKTVRAQNAAIFFLSLGMTLGGAFLLATVKENKAKKEEEEYDDVIIDICGEEVR